MPATPSGDKPTWGEAAPAAANPPRQPLSRCDFLGLLGKALLSLSGLLALGGLVRFLGYETEPPAQTAFDLGAASSYAPGSITPVPQAEAILIRTSGGFQALSSVCPHLGCTVQPSTDGFACPCHGSRFDRHGGLIQGPATRPMRSLRVEQTPDGRVVVHTDQDSQR